MYEAILVPIDGSACSDEAVAQSLGLAKATGARVVFLFVADAIAHFREGVVSLPEALATLTERGRTVLADADARAEAAGVPHASELTEGTPADVIVERAKDFELVVLGTHRKSLWQRLTVGSVTEAVLHRTTRPMLIVSSVSSDEGGRG